MNVRGDFLGPPHGTTTRALMCKESIFIFIFLKMWIRLYIRMYPHSRPNIEMQAFKFSIQKARLDRIK